MLPMKKDRATFILVTRPLLLFLHGVFEGFLQPGGADGHGRVEAGPFRCLDDDLRRGTGGVGVHELNADLFGDVEVALLFRLGNGQHDDEGVVHVAVIKSVSLPDERFALVGQESVLFISQWIHSVS